LKDICIKLQEGKVKKHYSWVNSQLLKKGKLVVGNTEQLRQELLYYFHNGSIGGHSGVKTTTYKICSLFYWKGLSKQVKKLVKECLVCQQYKPDLSAYLGLLQPLPIPKYVWSSISMDFIEGLPKSEGYNVIFVVVDRLTKDKIFLSLFWKELFGLLKVKLQMSTAYHPQSDGQTEVVNRCLETYLRCMTGDHPKEWSKWLPLAELCKVDAVDRTLEAREKAVQLLKFHLERAQNRMKQQTDKHRSERVLEVGDWVWLKLQPHRQVSLRQGKQNKFSSKYFGPFEIISRKCKGNHQEAVLVPLPQLNQEGLIEMQPMKLLDRKMVKKRNVMAIYGLIQWTNRDAHDATWELLEELYQRFPEFQLDS
ncbi:retrotransposon-related protein, partial [Tanacetum coccineum]